MLYCTNHTTSTLSQPVVGVLLVTTALCVERMGLPTSTGARLSVIRWRFSAKDLVLAQRNRMERKTKFKMEALKVLYLITNEELD